MTFLRKIDTSTASYKILIISSVLLCFFGIVGLHLASRDVLNRNSSDLTAVLGYEIEELIVDNEPKTPEPSEAETSKEKAKETVVPVVPEPEPVSIWPVTYSLEQAASITVVVNKKHRLPRNYVPTLIGVAGGQLRPEAAQALASMFDTAQKEDVEMSIISSYRSYDTQVATYNRWVSIDGQAQADRYSARPGHSEHQTGLAVDIGTPSGNCNLSICFGDTAQGKWLAANAYLYGFIIRYPSGKESLTGYQYEPWHLRYLGVETATAVKKSGLTLDQYFDVEAGDYQ